MISILPFQKATTATTFGGRFAVDLGHIDPSFYFSSSSSFPPFFYILFDQAQLFFFLFLLLLPPHSAARSLAFRPLMTRSLPVSTKSRERCRRNRKQRREGLKEEGVDKRLERGQQTEKVSVAAKRTERGCWTG